MLLHVVQRHEGRGAGPRDRGRPSTTGTSPWQELIATGALAAPRFWLNPEVKDFYDFTPEDVKLIDYNTHLSRSGTYRSPIKQGENKEVVMNLIVNADKNWAIGKDNRLLVSIPQDMKFFR